jgi:hypothetical protein
MVPELLGVGQAKPVGQLVQHRQVHVMNQDLESRLECWLSAGGGAQQHAAGTRWELRGAAAGATGASD